MSATIVIEDGTGKANSNSYVSETDLGTYATDRGFTLAASTDPLKADLLIRAMDYLELQPFMGVKYTDAQALQWPRYGVTIDHYYVDVDAIPQLLIDSLCELAIGIDGGDSPLDNVSRETKKEKVGDIEVEYMDGTYSQTYLKASEMKLNKLLKAGSGGINTAAFRA